MSGAIDTIPATQLEALLSACREIARMKHPSVEHLLRHRGFGFEADRIVDVVLAIEAIDGLRPRVAPE